MPMTAGPWSWLPALPIAVLAALYLAGVRRLRRRGDRWSAGRSACAAAGLVTLAAGLLPPVGGHGSFVVHVVGHLLVAMLAPLLLALAAPVTLALRTVRPPVRRRLLAVLHGRVARGLTWAPVVLLANLGGMYAFYLTPLFGLAHHHRALGLLVHLHMVLAGCLLSWLLVGRDPLPHRPRLPGALGVLLVAGAGHAVLAKLMYAHLLPAAGSPEEIRLGAQVMSYGGDVVEVATAVVLLATWYAREGRSLRRAEARTPHRSVASMS